MTTAPNSNSNSNSPSPSPSPLTEPRFHPHSHFLPLPPPKPTRPILKLQANLLHSFLPSSPPIHILSFASHAHQLCQSFSKLPSAPKPSQDIELACSLADLIGPLAPIFKDSNLLSELRDHQHELATPHGSLHALHASDPQDSPDTPSLKRPRPEPDFPADIPVHVEQPSVPHYLDPSLFGASENAGPGGPKPGRRRVRKKAAGPRQSLVNKPKPVQDLVSRLAATGLETLAPHFDGMWYVRSVGRSDWNTSTQPIFSTQTVPAPVPMDPPPVILTITFHPLSKAQENETKAIAPRKQTVHILSSQSLAELKDVMVCTADRIPSCAAERWTEERWVAGSVIGIENVLFADRRAVKENAGKADYGLLIHRLAPQVVKRKMGQVLTNSSGDETMEVSELGMESVRFDQLSVRVGEPYWLLHQGNCEHLFTVDEIRSIHATDPVPSPTTNPYPITTFLSRLTSPKCRVCDRDPARLVVIDDDLVAESPCFVCWTCFKLLHAHEIGEEAAAANGGIGNIEWGKVKHRDWWVVPLIASP